MRRSWASVKAARALAAIPPGVPQLWRHSCEDQTRLMCSWCGCTVAADGTSDIRAGGCSACPRCPIAPRDVPILGPDRRTLGAATEPTPEHRWEAMSYDPERAGCYDCGGERDARGWVRLPTERAFSPRVPVCKPIRNHVVPPLAENGRRANRVPDNVPHRRTLKGGERCPDCGYGCTSAESIRAGQDQDALEAETAGMLANTEGDT